MGVVAICIALSVMGIFALVLHIFKKKGGPPGGAAPHDDESTDGTPMTALSDERSPSGLSDNYFPKTAAMMPSGKLSTTSSSSTAALSKQQRSGSASSSNGSNFDLGSPETLVPPPRRDRGIVDGMSMDFNPSTHTSAAASLRNETMVNIEEPPSPVEEEREEQQQRIGRGAVRSWMVGDDGFSVGLGHPGNPYREHYEQRQSVPAGNTAQTFYYDANGPYLHPQRKPVGTLTPQMTGGSERTLTNHRWSPTSPPAPSNLRFEMGRD
jgi:hypothetical protein